MLYLSTILLSLFITVSLIPFMTRLAARFQMVDFPNPRKVHICPVPRIGGTAMAIGASVPLILWAPANDFIRAYLIGSGLLVITGLIDDMKGLGYKAKFMGQIFAALVAVLYGGVRIHSLGTLLPGIVQVPEWFAVSLSVVAVVGVTNAINLADGLDGLAGGISLLSFCCIGYLAYLVGSNVGIIMALSLAGAIFGFLRYNTHPASLFMGDTGSQLLGFSAAVLAIKITQDNITFSPVLPLIILGFPVLDTLTVMVERVREGRSPFSADKNHFHHRLLRLGLSHGEAVFMIYVIQAMIIVLAILCKYHSDWVLVTAYVVFSASVIGAFAVADRTGFRFNHKPMIGHAFQGRLRRIRDANWIIRVSFAVSKGGVPLLFLFSCLLPAKVPGYVAVISACFGLLMIAVRIFAKRNMGFCLRLVLYLTIPLVLYHIEAGRTFWVSEKMFTLYHLSFGIIAFFVLLTVKFTRRMKGFRITTMDFLVVFIAVVVPNLPDPSIQSYHLGLLATEIIVLLFSYEVLITELRAKYDALTIFTMISLTLLALRGGIGF